MRPSPTPRFRIPRRSLALLVMMLMVTVSRTPAGELGRLPTDTGTADIAGEGTLEAGARPYAWHDDGLLPFPSDVHTVSDPTTPTGLRVSLPDAIWGDALLKKAPFDVRPVLDRLRALDGFSPSVPLFLSVPGEVDPRHLPSVRDSDRPLSVVSLIDLETRRRLRFRHMLLPRSTRDQKATMLVVQPVDRLENQRRYLVVVRRGLKDLDGQVIPPARGFAGALTARALPGDAPRWHHYLQDLGKSLAAEGFAAADVAHAFTFTTESDESLRGALEGYYAQIRARADSPTYRASRLRVKRVWRADAGEAAIRANGSFEALTFHDDDGRRLAEPRAITLDFLLEAPAACPEGGCGVAIFGHGLSATKETMFQVADRFAREGIATVGVSAPHHTNLLSPTRVIYGSKRNLDLLHGVMLEHVLRNLQLAELIRQDLATGARDYQPRAGAPAVRLRADRIFYIGQSMGGICGVATTAMSPWIQASVFDVAGGSAIDLVFDSWVTKTMKLPLLRFKGMEPMEVNRIVPLAVYLFDDFDPLSFAPYVTRRPLPGRTPRVVAQQVGRGDGLVPNWTSEKLSRALGIPIVRSKGDAALPSTDAPGPGLRYFQLTGHWFLNHLALMKPQVSSAAAGFFAWSWRQLEPAAISSQQVTQGDVPTAP